MGVADADAAVPVRQMRTAVRAAFAIHFQLAALGNLDVNGRKTLK
jgi:hypothetical protein